jgi:hypothetical protein
MQAPRQDTNTITQLKPPIPIAGLRQFGRLGKLRNEYNISIKLRPEAANNHAINAIHINDKITKLLSLVTPISTLEAHEHFNKAIGTIVRQTSNTLTEKLRKKETKTYDKSPNHYHNNLKISSSLLLKARDQPIVVTLTDLITKTTHTKPQEIIDIVTTHYKKEQQSATPELLPKAPWTQPQNPDNFDINPPLHHTTPHHTQK